MSIAISDLTQQFELALRPSQRANTTAKETALEYARFLRLEEAYGTVPLQAGSIIHLFVTVARGGTTTVSTTDVLNPEVTAWYLTEYGVTPPYNWTASEEEISGVITNNPQPASP